MATASQIRAIGAAVLYYRPHIDALGLSAERVLLDALWRMDARQDPKGKFGNKRPGIPCGKGYISWRKKCSEGKGAIAQDRLKGTAEGKAYADRVRKFKGLEKRSEAKNAAFKLDSIEDANKALESIGISGHWRLPDKSNSPLSQDKLTLDAIERIASRVSDLKKAYPGAQMSDIGEAYQVEHDFWEEKLDRDLQKDKQKYEQRGKQWRKSAAIKRVAIREPMPADAEFSQNAAWVRASGSKGRWAGRNDPRKKGETFYETGESVYNPAMAGSTMAFSPNSINTKKTIDEDKAQRASDRKKTGSLYVTGESIEATVNHEFGHILDNTYGLSEHPEIVSMLRTAEKKEGGMERQISMYAATNDKEALAEAFSDSFFSDSSETSKLVRKKMDEIIKASGRGKDWRAK